jgi:methylenetetrahydrofolate reductase (NADPH)
MQHLVTKVRAGVDFIITQIFFNNRFYFDFVARARAAGITVPIIPGIMPITDVAQIQRMTKMCGASVPAVLRAELERRRSDAVAVTQLGVAQATAQCVDLLLGGAPGVHFYTLNQSPATRMILTVLKARL